MRSKRFYVRNILKFTIGLPILAIMTIIFSAMYLIEFFTEWICEKSHFGSGVTVKLIGLIWKID